MCYVFHTKIIYLIIYSNIIVNLISSVANNFFILAPLYKTNCLTKEKVQHRATKIITDLRDISYKERFGKLELPSMF